MTSAPITSPPELLRGDCLSQMPAIPDGSVDLAFADPPFNIGYEYDVYQDKRKSDDYLVWCRRWMAECVRVLKPNGTFWLAIGDEYAGELKTLMTRGLVVEPSEDAPDGVLPGLGLTMRSWVIWYYTFGVNCKAKFSRSHAHLFYMVKDADDFTFNADDPAVRVPSARQLVYADKRANPKGRLPDDTWLFPPDEETEDEQKGPPVLRSHNGWVLVHTTFPSRSVPMRTPGTFRA